MEKNTTRQDEQFTLHGKGYLVKRLFAYMLPFKKDVLLVLVLMIFVMVVGLINPYFIKEAIDVYIKNEDIKGLVTVTIVVLILNLLSAYASKVRIYKMGFVSNKIVLNLRENLYEHIQKLSFSFFDSRPVGKILARVVGDVNALQKLFSNAVTSFLPQVFQLILVTIFMFALNLKLALATMVVMPVLFSINIFVMTLILLFLEYFCIFILLRNYLL